MAAAPVLIDSGEITNNASSYNLPSLTPVSGEATTISVIARGSVGDVSITGTNGWNVTWERRDQTLWEDDDSSIMAVFEGVPSSGTTGVLTVDLSGDTAGSLTWQIFRHPDGDTGAANIIVQTKVGIQDAGDSVSITLDAAPSSPNYAFASCATTADGRDLVPDGDFTELDEFDGTESNSLSSAWRDAQDQSFGYTLSPTVTSEMALIGMEIAVSGGVLVQESGSDGFELGDSAIHEAFPPRTGNVRVIFS